MSPRLLPFAFVLLTIAGCTNPFAPGEREGDPFAELLGDPSTIEGFYTRFEKSYELRDTSLYGPLIHPEFTFTFRDTERNVDVTWSRSEEMNSTYNMFSQSHDISLQWNNIISQTEIEKPGESESKEVIRRFNLTVMVSQSEVYRTDGSAGFRLTRPDTAADWRLISWRDESDF